VKTIKISTCHVDSLYSKTIKVTLISNKNYETQPVKWEYSHRNRAQH